MNGFIYSYPVKTYLGEGAAAKYLPGELSKAGEKVMLAYGGGSVHKNGIYEEMISTLKETGKTL